MPAKTRLRSSGSARGPEEDSDDDRLERQLGITHFPRTRRPVFGSDGDIRRYDLATPRWSGERDKDRTERYIERYTVASETSDTRLPDS